jgi:hypothetical protein
MLKDIVEARATGGFRLFLRFEDGVEGELDLSEIMSFDGIFAPLREGDAFAAVRVHPELGTVVWPNGADLDPDVLYARITGKNISAFPAAAESA